MDDNPLEDPFKYDHNVFKIFSSNFTVTKNDRNGTYTIKNGIDLCLEFILFEFLNVKYEIARFSQNIIVNGKMLYIVMWTMSQIL